ncbi:MAG: ATP phosphoribosyltransferase regulatory subunit [Betaproteobacteria bacterium]|nr:ATP phosphoribosyltransferase regulatory subunit [Betaproteobacteria bacterium]NCP82426.1 ATP phosphoribosyltransferase regulatory subunit [Rhodoferax sp.]OIP21244.1 MAG: ATP phosphoribosyltransferase regulatory subunit [Comamonadaceae bacterium CG2_30_57_122]PIZ22090.1 MAG: ATP phosphoribosyltransferase regulatory subunit [Comamonadaceae bacterium CG_4_10_14_0_8_um_filter_57_29]PJC17602.1 MAG: ATP phosphoribosyltransferase regulatory subunit [Comamonadaceae bacterium CG_4_9_14_0_8_um_filter
MSAWVLPDHIADVLPSEARHIEELRRNLLDTARCYGYELVMPPLLEHLESLLSGSGEALDLQTFKLVDQLSGRMMGLRADSTPQVARIDAHLLNRAGVTRLCYCGSVLHTRASAPHATREPLQFGAEIYGHAGLEADIEVLTLALDCLRAAKLAQPSVDLADARLVKVLLAGIAVSPQQLKQLHAALVVKDMPELKSLTQDMPAPVRQGLLALVKLYGDQTVLIEAEKALPPLPGVHEALQNLKRLADHLVGVKVTFDLADLRGYSYYTGARFAIYAPGVSNALVRGGRYDEVGAVFGRNRPAAGFSLDIKALVSAVEAQPLKPAIHAPWRDDVRLSAALAALRAQGEIVVCVLPGHEREVDEFLCDRELIEVAGQWVVQAMN